MRTNQYQEFCYFLSLISERSLNHPYVAVGGFQYQIANSPVGTIGNELHSWLQVVPTHGMVADMGKFAKILKAVPVGLGSIVTLVIGVSPQDAVSNVSKWATLLGIKGLPAWLNSATGDREILVLMILGMAIYSLFAWGVIPLAERRYDSGGWGKVRMFLFIGIVISGIAFFTFTALYFWPHKNDRIITDDDPLDKTISAVCTQTGKPTSIRENKPLTIFLIGGIPGKVDATNSLNLAPTCIMEGSGLINWIENFPNYAFKCTIINYGKEPVFGVYLDLTIEWLEVLKAEGGSQSGKVLSSGKFISPKMDLGMNLRDEDYFYIMSSSKNYVRVILPDIIKIIDGKSDNYKSIKLLPFYSHLDKISMFPPSDRIENPTIAPHSNSKHLDYGDIDYGDSA